MVLIFLSVNIVLFLTAHLYLHVPMRFAFVTLLYYRHIRKKYVNKFLG